MEEPEEVAEGYPSYSSSFLLPLFNGISLSPLSARIAIVLSGLAISILAGCAPSTGMTRAWEARARFGEAEDSPSIVVYGSLAEHLPRFNPTPALDEFLYGPAPAPRTILRNPQGLALLGTKLLICDQGYQDIMAIDTATGQSSSWADRDHPPRCPVAIVVGEDGLVYVADTTLRAVIAYSPNGQFVQQLAPSNDPNRLFRPTSLLFGDTILYVGNVGEHRVDRWNTAEGKWLSPVAPEVDGSGLIAPTGLAMTGDGVLLIADSVRARVFRMSPEGKWLEPIGRPGRQRGEFVRPKQVCVTPGGLIFVTDAGRQSVLVFAGNGDFVAEVKERPNEWRGFTLPMGLLAVPAEGLDCLMAEPGPRPEPQPDEWVMVTDTLSASSVNLLGVFLPAREEANNDAAQ